MLRGCFFPHGWRRRRGASPEAAGARNKIGAMAARSSGENGRKGKPLVPMAGNCFFENGAPLRRTFRDVSFARAAGLEADRSANDDLVAATSRSRDEEWIDRRLRNQAQ